MKFRKYNMMISAKDKVSSFLRLLQQVCHLQKLSLLQHELEILAGQEARLVEIAEKALLLANSRQEPDGFASAAKDPGNQ